MNRIIYIGEDQKFLQSLHATEGHLVESYPNAVGFQSAMHTPESIAMIFSDYKLRGLGGLGIYERFRNEFNEYRIPYGIIVNQPEHAIKHTLLNSGISEIYPSDVPAEKIGPRIVFLKAMLEARLSTKVAKEHPEYKIPVSKRIFDIAVAGMGLIVASPVLLLAFAALKLESRGPLFYVSKRVGTGYKVFDFYKLRSMYIDADQRMADMKHLNQYAQEAQQKMERKVPRLNGTSSPTLIYKDGAPMKEEEYLKIRKIQQAGTFVKIKDDPRVTGVGMFLRNTSIDELPQLINVLKGDMSIVGNRPLPLYEAEQLTSDDWGERFLAPAGITGLWQVMKRGKGDMSEEERKALDNRYARKVSLWNDIKLILQTIPALFQKENV